MKALIDQGILNQFGIGYHGVRRGEVIHVYKCRPVIARVRSISNITADIPVTFEDIEDNTLNMFMNPFSKKIRNSTIYYRKSELFQTKFNINGKWYCNNNFNEECAKVKGLPLKFSTLDTTFEDTNIESGNVLQYMNLSNNLDILEEEEKSKAIEDMIIKLVTQNYSEAFPNIHLIDLPGKMDGVENVRYSIYIWHYVVISIVVALLLYRIVFVLIVFSPYVGWWKYISFRNIFIVLFASKDTMLECIDKERQKSLLRVYQ